MKEKIAKYIMSEPFNFVQGKYHSTGWIVFKKENLATFKTLTGEIENLQIDETLLRWRRVIEMSKNCKNKIK